MESKSLQLLMVDDDADDFVLVRHVLHEALPSLTLDYAATCEDALQRAQRQNYDVIFLDYRLGAQNGIGLLREFRRCQVDTPVIMLTGHGDSAIAVEAMKAGATDYLNKSKLNDSSLKLAIRYAVNLHRKETLLRDAHGQIRANEQRFRALVENSFEAIHLLDRGGAILWASKGNQHLFGYTPAEMAGRNRSDFIHPEDLAESRLLLQDCSMHADGRIGGEFRHRHKNGGWRNVEVMATNCLADPAVGAIVINLRDVTERRALQQQVMQMQKMEAVGQLAGGVAHDFNNLLMVISSYSEMLLDSMIEPRQRHNLEQVLKASKRAAALTQQLLAFGRKQVLAPTILDLNTVVADMAKMLSCLIGEHVRLCIHPGAGLGKVKADPVQIEQVLMNLAANARDAMPTGGALTITTANIELDQQFARLHPPTLPGHYVLLAVSDTGSGIPPELQARIFEPFFTTKERGKGTGLGLSTVYGIVKQSGGYIWLDSTPGCGSIFQIYLPMVELAAALPQKPHTPDSRPTGRETLLLVEDEDAVREATSEFLRSSGYTVLSARDGEEATDIGLRHGSTIHLLLTDVVMPGMSGRQLAESLHRHCPEMKVLYISGYAESTILQHGVADLTTAFLQKPFTLAALARKIRQVIEDRTPAETAALPLLCHRQVRFQLGE